MTAYRARRPARREALPLRGLTMNVTRWGPEPGPRDPCSVLLHGWQDNGATFQCMVDGFEGDMPLVALDWRGFGHSEWAPAGYWFADYLADLDALVDRLSPGDPVRLVGHSLGGNVALLYAGLRPDRVRCVVSVEGFGLPRTRADRAPKQLRDWLDRVKSPPPFKEYQSIEQLAALIRARNPRLTAPKAHFLAQAWSHVDHGRLRLLGDPRHQWPSAQRYLREDAEACWRHIKAAALMLLGTESGPLKRLEADDEIESLRRAIPHLELERVDGAGHLLHIEASERVAALIETFLSRH